jgi:hypothetical protein
MKDERYVNGNPNWNGGTIALDLRTSSPGKFFMIAYIPVRGGSLVTHEFGEVPCHLYPESLALRELPGLGIVYKDRLESVADGVREFGKPFNVWYDGVLYRGPG